MTKRILQYRSAETSLPVTIGLATQLRDYRLVHLINNLNDIPFSLKRSRDYPIPGEDDQSGIAFPLYIYRDEESYNQCLLIANRFLDYILMPELKSVDYLLLIEGPFGFQKIDALIASLRRLPDILMASVIDMKQVRQFPFMVHDLEMHLMQKESN